MVIFQKVMVKNNFFMILWPKLATKSMMQSQN